MSNTELIARLRRRSISVGETGGNSLCSDAADALEAAATEHDEAHRRGYEDAICHIYPSADADPEILAQFMDLYELPTKAST